MAEVRFLAQEDAPRFAAHLTFQAAESGREGLPIFNPFERDHRFDPVAVERRRRETWAVATGTPGWSRALGVFVSDDLVGHLELDGGTLAADQHRARLSMGIERAHHRQGLGSLLMKAALRWVAGVEGLDWIDLYVFAHNDAARALYEAHGFRPQGSTADRFRVGGQSIADVHMSLALARP